MKNLQELADKVLSAYEKKYAYDNDEVKYWRFKLLEEGNEDEVAEIIANAMNEGDIELDKDFILYFFENFYDIYLECDGSIAQDVGEYFVKDSLRDELMSKSLEKFNNEKIIVDLIFLKMKNTDEVAEILNFASSMNEKTIKMMLQDKEIMKKIYNEMEDSNKILSYFIVQLGKYKELCDDKEFMMQFLDNVIEEFDIRESLSGRELSEILKNNCKELWKDKEFNQKIIELVNNQCDENLIGLGEHMLQTEELANDRELALEYCKAFFCFGNVSKDFLKDKEFLTKLFDGLSGDVLEFVYSMDEKDLKTILQEKEIMDKICDLGPKYTNLDKDEMLSCYIYKLSDCKKLCNNKEFMMQLLDNIEEFNIKDTQISYELTEVLKSNCEELWKDKEFKERIIELVKNHCDENLINFCEYMSLTKELAKDKKFLKEILDDYNDIGSSFILPKEFCKDEEIVKKYFENNGRIVGINFEVLRKYGVMGFNGKDDVYELVEVMEKNNIEDIPEKYEFDDMRYALGLKIKETGTVVTHFGDDLDNKSAIEAIQRWAEDNDLIKVGQKLNIIRVPAGQIKEGYLNVDTGGHEGSRLEEDGTIIIDGDLNYGVKSASQELSKLGIYVPEQIVELADTKTNKVSALDSRSGLALVRYLTGEQTFRLAEAELLDKSLTDEQLEEYGLIEAHKKQQGIIDNALEKIEKYTEELPDGQKIVIAKEQILGGSAIAYEKGINYYVSVSEHLDENKNSDGVTFAITSKPGIELPDDILDYGKELVEEYRIDEKSSGVFVSPNNQMIVAGGFKNPQFKIPGKTIDEIAEEIKDKFLVQEKEDAFVNTIVSNAKEKKELEQKNGQAQTLLSEIKKLNNKKTK